MANEKRLIDVNAEIRKIRDVLDDTNKNIVYQTAEIIIAGLEKAPTVDAVEVVRCKDCTQWGGVTFGNVCRRWSAPLAGMRNCTGPDEFCSYGERGTDHA